MDDTLDLTGDCSESQLFNVSILSSALQEFSRKLSVTIYGDESKFEFINALWDKVMNPSTCRYVLQRGVNRGTKCDDYVLSGEDYCKNHIKHKDAVPKEKKSGKKKDIYVRTVRLNHPGLYEYNSLVIEQKTKMVIGVLRDGVLCYAMSPEQIAEVTRVNMKGIDLGGTMKLPEREKLFPYVLLNAVGGLSREKKVEEDVKEDELVLED